MGLRPSLLQRPARNSGPTKESVCDECLKGQSAGNGSSMESQQDRLQNHPDEFAKKMEMGFSSTISVDK